MKISEQQLLEIEIKMNSLITKREGMLVANQDKFSEKGMLAYNEEDFNNLRAEFDEQYNTLVRLGEK